MLLALLTHTRAWPVWFRMAGATGCILAAVLLSFALFGDEGSEGYVAFVPMLVLCGILFGFPVGLAAIGIAWIVATYLFVEPALSFIIDDPFDLLSAILFPILTALLLALVELLLSILAAGRG